VKRGGDVTTTLGGSDLLDSAAGMPAGWNSTDRDYPVEQCVHTLVEQQVDRMPSRVALRQGDRTLTFAELDERANQLAHHLRANGVGRDVPVGILLDRSTDAFVAVLAVLKAGGYYVPVDSSYPSERIGFSLTDAGAETVVTRSDLTDRLPTGIRSRITVDGDAARIATRPTTRPAPAATPDDLAYLTYTSGSTGRPKGVMVEHRGVVNYLLWAIETFPMTGRHGTACIHRSASTSPSRACSSRSPPAVTCSCSTTPAGWTSWPMCSVPVSTSASFASLRRTWRSWSGSSAHAAPLRRCGHCSSAASRWRPGSFANGAG
jgi:non-ribosomal peptide synthetase component F